MSTHEYRWDHAGAPVLAGVVGNLCAFFKTLLVGTAGIAYGSRPSAGWSVVWEDTGAHKLVLRNDMTAGGNDCYLRIVDDGSGAAGARAGLIQCYESMSDIDTGTAPASAANSGAGVWIRKSDALSGSARVWVLCANALRFLGGVYPLGGSPPSPGTSAASAAQSAPFGGGPIVPSIPADPSVFVCGLEDGNSTTLPSHIVFSQNGNSSTGSFAGQGQGFALSRDSSLSVSSTPARLLTPGAITGSTSNAAIGGNLYLPTPTPGHSGDHAVPAHVAAGGTLRGHIPGLYLPMNAIYGTRVIGDTLSPLGVASPRTMVVVSGWAASTQQGRLLIDTGPWE